MRRIIFISISALLLSTTLLAVADDPPKVYQSDPHAMAAERERAMGKDPASVAGLSHLKEEADKALKSGPYSVTQKKHPSPTGDPHDYISLAPYFWPNPDTKDGLPYVRHDGRRNPEIREYDASNFSTMSGHAYTLALAFYLTGNEAYADHAALLLRTWLIDPATRMNPNLEHAQLVKGVNDGRGTGVLEADRLLNVVDAVGLIRGSKSWTIADDDALRGWFRQFVQWMRQSKRGRDEAAAKNNHGVWYDVQLVTYLRFIGDDATARKVIEEAKTQRIASQIQPDGSMPLELARTNSLGYTVFNLAAMTQLADLGVPLGVDLWNFKTPDGRGIRAAIDYVLPYVLGQKKWEKQQITQFSDASVIDPLRRAAIAYHDPKYAEAAKKVAGENPAEQLRRPLK
jgi:hypothetical protein